MKKYFYYFKVIIVISLAVLLTPLIAASISLSKEGISATEKLHNALKIQENTMNLFGKGKYDEALKQQRIVVESVASVLGQENATYFDVLSIISNIYLNKGDYKNAEKNSLHVLELRKRHLGQGHPSVAISLDNLSSIYIALARYDEAETVLKEALKIRLQALQKSDPFIALTYNSLGYLYVNRSDFGKADEYFREAWKLVREHQSPQHQQIEPTIVTNLGEIARHLGQFSEADRLQHDALQLAKKIYGADNQISGKIANNLGLTYEDQGRYADAEKWFRRSLAISEKLNDPGHPSVAVSLNNLGLFMLRSGRPEQALALFNRAHEIQIARFDERHPEVLTTLNNLALAHSDLGQNKEAERLYWESLEGRRKANKIDKVSVARALINLAAFLGTQERYIEAEPYAREALAILEQELSSDQFLLAHSLGALAVSLDEQEKHGEAKKLYERAKSLQEKTLGAQHPELALTLGNLSAHYLDQKKWQQAYDLSKQGNDIWTSRLSLLTFTTGDDRSIELKQANSFLNTIIAGYELGQSASLEKRKVLSEESFKALQWASISKAANAFAKMSGRIEAGSEGNSALIREKQDLADKLRALDNSLISAITQKPGIRSAQGEADLQKEIQATRLRLKQLEEKLSKSSIRVAEIAAPKPSSISDVRQQLRDDEALYTIALTRRGSFAWLITRNKERWIKIDRTAEQIKSDIAVLRCGLDETSWMTPEIKSDDAPATQKQKVAQRAKANACKEALNEVPHWKDRRIVLPFDHGRAYELYKALFGQVEDLIRDKHLLVVPSGALTQLPFQVLVTAPLASGDHKTAAWLARDHAITVLPAVSSLKALRRTGRPSAAPEPLIGFGNPLLDGKQDDPKYGKDFRKMAQRARAMQSCPKNLWQHVAGLFGLRGGMAPIETHGGQIHLETIRMQSPLPETADELCAVARDIGADTREIYLGARATEHQVKTLSKTGKLADYRIVHFATHGAIAGELNKDAEPGLILTPPDQVSEDDDGYLSVSEIAALKLDADWVILSACNTAAGSRSDAEALSGLGRAFIYAQARALLVSHWYVDSDATVKLITTAIREIAKDKKVGRSEALRRAMLWLIDKGEPHQAHPAYWAPFIVVGEGAIQQ